MFRISVKFLIVATGIISTAASLGCGLLLYLEGIRLLEVTVEELSKADTDSIGDILEYHFNQTETLAEVLHDTIRSWNGFRNREEFADYLSTVSLSSTRNYKTLYGQGVFVVPLGDPRVPSDKYFYDMVWYDRSATGTIDYLRGTFEPEKAWDCGRFHCIDADYIDANNGSTLKLAYVYADALPELMYRTCITNENPACKENATTGFWRPPSVWYAGDGYPGLYLSYHRLLIVDSDYPSFLAGTMVASSTYLEMDTWQDVLTSHETEAIIIIVGDLDKGKSSNVLAYNQNVAFSLDESRRKYPEEWSKCTRDNAATQQSHCVPKLDMFPDCVAESAALLNSSSSFRRRSTPCGDRWLRRQFFTNPKPGVDDLEPYSLLWMRNVSSIESELDRAFFIFITFLVVVFVFDIMIALSEIIFVARPLARLAEGMGRLQELDLEALDVLLTVERNNFVAEVHELYTGMRFAVTALAEYKKFIPAAFFADSEEVDSIESPIHVSQSSAELLMSERVPSIGEVGLTTLVVIEPDNICWRTALEKRSDGAELCEAIRDQFMLIVTDEIAMRASSGSVLTLNLSQPTAMSTSMRRGSVAVPEVNYALGTTAVLKFDSPSQAVTFCVALQVRLVRETWPQQLLDLETRENRSGHFDSKNSIWGGPRTVMYISTVCTDGRTISDFDMQDMAINCSAVPDGVIVLSEAAIEACGGLSGLSDSCDVIPLGCTPFHREVEEETDEPFIVGIVAKELSARTPFISDAKNQIQNTTNNPHSSLPGPSGKVARSGLIEKEISVAHICTSWGVGTGVASQNILDTLLVAVDSTAKRTNATLLNTYGSAVVVHWSTVQVSASVHFAGYLHDAIPFSRRKRIHVGVSSGTAQIGSVGGKQRFMTAIGEPLTIAAEHSETAAEMNCLLVASRIPNNSSIKRFSRIIDTRITPTETLYLYQVHAVAYLRNLPSYKANLKAGCFGNLAWDDAFRTRNTESIAELLKVFENSNLKYIARAAGLFTDTDRSNDSVSKNGEKSSLLRSVDYGKSSTIPMGKSNQDRGQDRSDSLQLASPLSPLLQSAVFVSPTEITMDPSPSGHYTSSSCSCLVAVYFLDIDNMSVTNNNLYTAIFSEHQKDVRRLVSACNGRVEDFYDENLFLIFFKSVETAMRLSLGLVEQGRSSVAFHIVSDVGPSRTMADRIITSSTVNKTIKIAKYMQQPRLVFSDNTNDIIKTRHSCLRLSTKLIGDLRITDNQVIAIYCGIPVGHPLHCEQTEVSTEDTQSDQWKTDITYSPPENAFPATKYLVGDRQLSAMLLPWLLSFGGGVIMVLVLSSIQTRWVGFISISVFSLLTMGFSFYIVTRRRVSIPMMTMWLISASILASYIPDYAGNGESDYWVISILSSLVCLAIHPEVASATAIQLLYVLTFIYIVVDAVLSSNNIPWDYSVINAFLRLLLFTVGHCGISYLKSSLVSERVSMKSLQQVILELSVILRDYDIESARELISDFSVIDDVSKGALHGIIQALSQYRAYLPQTLSFEHTTQGNEAVGSDTRNPLVSDLVTNLNQDDHTADGQVRTVGSGLDGVSVRFGNTVIKNRSVTLSLYNIVGVLRVAKKASPRELLKYHEVYVVGVLDDIKKNMGVAEQLSGDRILVSYNANTRCYGHQCRAVKAAHSYTRNSLPATNDLLGKLLPKLPSIVISIGVASGVALCGDMGSASMRKYTILGDVSSLVQCCERLCAAWQTSIICDDLTKEESQYQFNFKLMDQMHFSKRTPSLVRVYQLVGILSTEWLLTREDQNKNPWAGYNNAVSCMLSGEYSKARQAVSNAKSSEVNPRFLSDALTDLDLRINDVEAQHGGNPPRPLPEIWGEIMHSHSLPGWIV